MRGHAHRAARCSCSSACCWSPALWNDLTVGLQVWVTGFTRRSRRGRLRRGPPPRVRRRRRCRRSRQAARAPRAARLARWAWRQLTSMRTALRAAVPARAGRGPGSLLPQRGIDPARAAQFAAQHPALAPWYDRLVAVRRLLLAVVRRDLPAAVRLARRLRAAAQPAAPRRRRGPGRPARPGTSSRLPAHESSTTDARPSDVLAAARAGPAPAGGSASTSARRCRSPPRRATCARPATWSSTWRCCCCWSRWPSGTCSATGQRAGRRGRELLQHRVRLRHLDARAAARPTSAARAVHGRRSTTSTCATSSGGEQRGAPRDFRRACATPRRPDAPQQPYDLRVNHPLEVDGTKVFLLGNGYAPVFTVRDGTGQVVSRGPVPFLPRDGNNTSAGVVKVPGSQAQQLGFDGLLPADRRASTRATARSRSSPGSRCPGRCSRAWTGDLGSTAGRRSRSTGSTSRADPGDGQDGRNARPSLAPGDTMTLPDGRADHVRRRTPVGLAAGRARPGHRAGALAAALLALAA